MCKSIEHVISSHRAYNNIRFYLIVVVRKKRSIHVFMPAFPHINKPPIFPGKEFEL